MSEVLQMQNATHDSIAVGSLLLEFREDQGTKPAGLSREGSLA